MKQSDRIWQHVVDRHFVSAWRARRETLEVRAGNVHKESGLVNRMPAICSVLGGQRFQRLTRSRLVERRGASQWCQCDFRFPSRLKISAISRHEYYSGSPRS
jgi:hypothetical protein